MSNQRYIKAFQDIAPFRIRFKKDSSWQRILAKLIAWYIPTYLTHYTTIIGRTIFFPTEKSIERSHLKFTIAHEVVHLLDQKRLTWPVFIFLYLSPQIFVLGVLSFPWIGWNACWFLLFGLPWPSPGRSYLEARAYGLEWYLYSRCRIEIDQEKLIQPFTSSDYYFMSWSRGRSRKAIKHFYTLAQEGKDEVFIKVVETFEACE